MINVLIWIKKNNPYLTSASRKLPAHDQKDLLFYIHPCFRCVVFLYSYCSIFGALFILYKMEKWSLCSDELLGKDDLPTDG